MPILTVKNSEIKREEINLASKVDPSKPRQPQQRPRYRASSRPRKTTHASRRANRESTPRSGRVRRTERGRAAAAASATDLTDGVELMPENPYGRAGRR